MAKSAEAPRWNARALQDGGKFSQTTGLAERIQICHLAMTTRAIAKGACCNALAKALETKKMASFRRVSQQQHVRESLHNVDYVPSAAPFRSVFCLPMREFTVPVATGPDLAWIRENILFLGTDLFQIRQQSTTLHPTSPVFHLY